MNEENGFIENRESYSGAREYQKIVKGLLEDIFGEGFVNEEWDSVEHDPHTSNHKYVYAPRTDIAVGPFNSFFDLDIGNDKTAIMKEHPLVQKIEKETKIFWNDFARCFLAIEIVFSGTSKYIAGDILNASATGSVGFIVAHEKEYEKVRRIHNYYSRLDGYGRLGRDGIRNLIVFNHKNFIEFLQELKYPERAFKLEDRYQVYFKKGLFSKRKNLIASSAKSDLESSLIEVERLKRYGFNKSDLVRGLYIVLSSNSNKEVSSAYIHEFKDLSGEMTKMMDIICVDIGEENKKRGIGGGILLVFEEIAKNNGCNFVGTQIDLNKNPEEKIIFEEAGFKGRVTTVSGVEIWIGRKNLPKVV